MKRIPHEPHLVGRPRLLASLGLLLLSALAGHAQQAGTNYFRLSEGVTTQDEIPLVNPCKGPHRFSLKFDKEFTRLVSPPEVILGKTSTPIKFQISAVGLKMGRYSSAMSIECLDCGGDQTCAQLRRRLIFDLTVTRAVTAGKDPPADIKAVLALELKALLDEFESKILGLKTYPSTTDRGGKVVGYDTGDVEGLQSYMKQRLRNLFGNKRLFAMQDYVDQKFPLPALEKISITTEERRASLLPSSGLLSAYAPGFRAGWRPRGQMLVVPQASANAAFKYVRGFIGYVIDNSGTKTLRVQSTPDEAQVLLVMKGGEPTSTVTNHDLPHFWPGMYHLTVSKQGFKTINQGWVDFTLYDTIKCDLKTDYPLPCKLN